MTPMLPQRLVVNAYTSDWLCKLAKRCSFILLNGSMLRLACDFRLKLTACDPSGNRG